MSEAPPNMLDLHRLVDFIADKVADRVSESLSAEQGDRTELARYFTVSEVAEAVRVSPKTVRRAIARRELDAAKVANGTRYVISAEAVQRWLAPVESQKRAQPGRAYPRRRSPSGSLRAALRETERGSEAG